MKRLQEKFPPMTERPQVKLLNHGSSKTRRRNEPIKDHRPQEKGSPGTDPLVPEEINKPIKDEIQKTGMENALTTFDD